MPSCRLLSPPAGTGSIVKFVSVAAGREPTVVGKPAVLSKDIIEAAHGKLDATRTMMVGDRYAYYCLISPTIVRVYKSCWSKLCWETYREDGASSSTSVAYD